MQAPPLPYDDGTYAQQRLRWLMKPNVERTVALTDHATTQLYDKLGPAHYGKGSNKSLPSEYLAKFPPAMRADILNWTLERSPSTWKVRLYEDTCRAVLDGDYPRVWNTEVLRQLDAGAARAQWAGRACSSTARSSRPMSASCGCGGTAPAPATTASARCSPTARSARASSWACR